MTRRRRLPRPSSLGGRLMTAQLFVIVVGSLTLALAAGLVAPSLFRQHLARSGLTTAPVRHHAEDAFAAAFALSLTLAAAAALIAAVVASWILVRQVTGPIEQLAQAADAVAAGRYDVQVPRVRFSTELQRLSDAYLHMASRLAGTDAARSRLLSDLSHELRTPLATLSAYIDGLEDGVVAPSAQSFQTMRSQVNRLHRLTIDVREAANADEDALDLHLAPADPVAIAHAAIRAAQPRYAEHGVDLAYQGPPAGPTIIADPQRLNQVLANLLDNALRHTPRGGHVTVSVDAPGRQVIVRVADDGTGVPPDQLEAIFERFHRGDDARTDTGRTGSGLGLTIARAIVHAHGGTLTAANVHHGAVFTITVPPASHEHTPAR
jgi:two-component system, OmpR family, sensor histidine kinase BaeS